MTPGLRVIDGTPTAISKFIREEEERRKCPKCGSEMMDCAVLDDEPPMWICPVCYEEKVGGEKDG